MPRGIPKNGPRKLKALQPILPTYAEKAVLKERADKTQDATRVLNSAQRTLDEQYESEMLFLEDMHLTKGVRPSSVVFKRLAAICETLEEIERLNVMELRQA